MEGGIEKPQQQVSLSLWALEMGLSAVVPSLVPRLGKPVARTREDVNNLAVDKHEKALVANVIAPQDIGVTYDMIGGLEAVKETLRQCITYPLKYPRLYQEGIANEAVKGVLLFGPPGTGKTVSDSSLYRHKVDIDELHVYTVCHE
jgi:SpoVK/Ycf46/Vps4 family AAA+-type ATPase